jgi:hypothetical protein
MSIEWAKKFKTYHIDNPHIYKAFEDIALQVAATGRVKFAVRNIFAKMRWDMAISGNDEYKINENYSAYYGRLFEEKNPKYVGFFRKKNILPDDFSLLSYVGEA